MAIVHSEIEADRQIGPARRVIYYRCQDDAGEWHRIGPIFTADPAFDAAAQMPGYVARLEESLADAEFQAILEAG